MIPTIFSSESIETPFIEFTRSEITPFLALILDSGELVSDECYRAVKNFLYLNTIILSERNLDFAVALRRICEQVVRGRVIAFNPERVSAYEIGPDILFNIEGGEVSNEVKQAAARFLTWADEHKAEYPILE